MNWVNVPGKNDADEYDRLVRRGSRYDDHPQAVNTECGRQSSGAEDAHHSEFLFYWHLKRPCQRERQDQNGQVADHAHDGV